MHGRTTRWAVRAGVTAAVTLLLPAAAQAATAAPGVSTGGAANVQQQTARLTGAVDPNGLATKYQFQYGTTSAYGAVTPEAAVAGDGRKAVTADISGLAPNTKYHYRLIAHNDKGLTKGADRTFTTKKQPLGVTFAATPNPEPFGGTTTLAGTLTGTDNANRDVVLQSNPFPYTQGFKPVGSKVVTDPQGNFTFNLLQVPLNTQYRVALPDKPSVVSPIVVVSVQVSVSSRVGTYRLKKGHKLTFAGAIRPAVDGTPIAIQKKSGDRWVTVAGTAARHNSSASSIYSKKVTIHRGGTYRVYAGVTNGSFVPNTGREIHIRTK